MKCFEQQVDYAFDFMQFLMDHPDELDKIPDDATIVFIENGKPIMDIAKLPKDAKIYYVEVSHQFEFLLNDQSVV